MSITWNYINLSKNKKGFTILEILIAVFILAVVLSTVYAAYSGTFRIMKELEGDEALYGMTRNTMQRMLKDLAAVTASGGAFKFVSRPAYVTGGNFTDLTFLARAHLAWSEKEFSGAPAEITYYVEEDTEGGYRLLRRDTPSVPAANDGPAPRGFVVCEGLQALKYTFTDRDGQEHDSWDSTTEGAGGKNRAPVQLAVELKLVNPQDRERPYTFFTRAFLPAATVAVTPP
ncbi:MAG: prepilin-type N-terminal cleavage/methylation domain-containing protein [Syntrophales bacterium]